MEKNIKEKNKKDETVLMKVALIEYNNSHDELFLGFVEALEKNCHQVSIFTSRENIKKDIVFNNENLELKKICRRRSKRKTRLSNILNRFNNKFLNTYVIRKINKNYDYVILNSIEPSSIIEKVKYLKKKIIVVIHNGDFVDKKVFRKFYLVKKPILVVLSDHICKYLAAKGYESYVFHPIVFPGIDQKKDFLNTNIVVQGRIEILRKNYDSLVLSVRNNNNSSFYIVGKETEDNKIILNYFKYHGVMDQIHIISNLDNYKKYYSFISRFNFIIFLINENTINLLPYLVFKCTSSVNLVYGFNIIPIVDRTTAKVYDIEDISIMYERDPIEAIEKINEMTVDDIRKLSELIEVKRVFLLKENSEILRRIMC